MTTLELDGNLMLKTAHPEIYKKWVDEDKSFTRQYEVFMLALGYGILKNQRSRKKPNSDIVRLGQSQDDNWVKCIRPAIELLSVVACEGQDVTARWNDLLALADGGLELLWTNFQAQGVLDLPRFLAEAKKEWPDRAKELLKKNHIPA